MDRESLKDTDLPAAFQAADASSTTAQKIFLGATRVRLIGLVAAGAFGLATWKTSSRITDWAGVLAAICFFTAVTVEIYILKTRPERTWYEGRAAAESVKTLSWRYAVGGEPFGIRPDDRRNQQENLFLREIDEVIGLLRDLNLPAQAHTGPQVTDQMHRMRLLPIHERKKVYETDRVAEQQAWYNRKAAWNSRRAFLWMIILLLVEILGVVAAILKALGVIEGDLLIFAGAITASVSAWLQTKQHETLATAYNVTALELASVRTKIKMQETEDDWAKFVSEAEEAFSREHTLWKASRGVRSL